MQLLDSTMSDMCGELVALGDSYMRWAKTEDSYDIERNLRAAFYYLDKIHMFHVSMGHEAIDEIGWMTLYEYYAGERRLRELQASKVVQVPGMGHPKDILTAVQYFKEKGL